ncbi:MAG: MFS transporter [Pseudomonadales bacterium]|jgi:Na+/melibiose symporter-like transporter
MKVTTKLGYGVGQLSDGVKQAAFNTFLFFYYNQVLGLSASLAGAAALIALLIDAITDPMVGQWSDRIRSRFGRRHPFMVAAIIPFGIAIALLFSPPAGLDQMGLFLWMGGFAIGVRIALTLFFVPHLSLGAELTDGYHARTSLIGYRVLFTYAGILVVSVIGFTVFFPATAEYTNGLLNAESYPSFGFFCAVLGMIAMLWSVLSTRQFIPQLRRPSDDQVNTAGGALFAVINVFKTLKQQSFRVLFTSSLYFNALVGTIQTLLIYLGTYIFGFSPEYMGILALSLVIGILFASNVAQVLSRRFDKKMAAAICVSAGAVLAVSPTILFLFGVLQTMGEGSKLLFIFTVNGLSQALFIGFVILLDSMLTDTIDEHYLESGRREEGLFFAARAFATKASYGLGAFIAGIALEIISFPKGVDPSAVPIEAVWALAWFAGPVLMVLFIGTTLITNQYGLDAETHREITDKIKEREANS